jgi:hypothetical protein
MSIVSFFIAVILGLLIYAPFIRLSSRIILKVGLQWRMCLIFSAVFYVILIIKILLENKLQISISNFIAIPIGILFNLLYGTIFLGKYGKHIDGNKLGYKIGLKISALGMALMLLFVIFLFGLLVIIEMLRHNQ